MVYKVGSYRPADTGFGADDAHFLQPQRLQHDPARDHLQGPRAEPARRRRRARLLDAVPAQRRDDRAGARQARHLHPARLPPGPLQRALPGRGLARLAGARRRRPRRAPAGLSRQLPRQRRRCNRAFDNFWANAAAEGRRPPGRLRGRLAAGRRQRFEREPYVLGYDLLNEPWPGSAFGRACAEHDGLPDVRLDHAHRRSRNRVDRPRSARSTRATLVFYEPLVTFDFGADSAHGDTGDPRGRLLASTTTACRERSAGRARGPACEPLEDMVVRQRRQAAPRRPATSPLLTEFGATDDLETIARIVRLADDHMISWQ